MEQVIPPTAMSTTFVPEEPVSTSFDSKKEFISTTEQFLHSQAAFERLQSGTQQHGSQLQQLLLLSVFGAIIKIKQTCWFTSRHSLQQRFWQGCVFDCLKTPRALLVIWTILHLTR
jgi:hypothetical protein